MSQIVATLLFLLSGIICFSLVVVNCWKSAVEISLGKTHPSSEVEAQMVAPKYMKILTISGVLYIIEVGTMRGAFLAFYWGLFGKADTRLVYVHYTAIGFTVSVLLGLLLSALLVCRPFANNWTSDLEVFSKCAIINNLPFNDALSSLNIANDTLILVVPLTIIASLTLKRLEKFGICAIFLVGILSPIATGVRYSIVRHGFVHPPATLGQTHNLEIWSMVEVIAGYLAFTMFSLRAVFLRHFGSRGRPGAEFRFGPGSYSSRLKSLVKLWTKSSAGEFPSELRDIDSSQAESQENLNRL